MMSDTLKPSLSRESALAGVRVLDIATFIAAPFCGTILADFGADVIKIEQPADGDALRKFGTVTECGDSLVWLSEARNKKTATLDLRQPRGAELFEQLVGKSDVLLENFRPGTLEKWGLGVEKLQALNPGLIVLRVSAYGQTGPKRDEPGFARIAHAFAGLSYLAGMPDGPPVVPGSTSLADYLSGLWGAVGVMMALRVREATGRGQCIDIGLYESVFRLMDELALAYGKYGVVRERMGPDAASVVPHSHYLTRTGEWIALACTSDKMFQRLAQMMGRPELADIYPTSADRVASRDHVNNLVADWVLGRTLREVMDATQANQVPCAQLYSIRDIFNDPQYEARHNLMHVNDPRVGDIVIPAAMPKLSATPPRFRHTGRSLGADNEEVYQELLGLSAEELDALRLQKIV